MCYYWRRDRECGHSVYIALSWCHVYETTGFRHCGDPRAWKDDYVYKKCHECALREILEPLAINLNVTRQQLPSEIPTILERKTIERSTCRVPKTK
ncbi:hypothetical protein EAF04_002950 [Stromatinia cepivora]|nr:hypothetical protein EAF04_002950 [Stromatinia cepivora]